MSELWQRVRAGELLNERIIDCHGHMGPWYNFHIADPWAPGMVASMDTCGISRVIVSPHVAIGPDAALGNELISEAVRRFPARISGYCTVSPHLSAEEAVGELEKHVGRGNLIAIKIHPSLHGRPAGCDGYRPMWEWAQQRRVPVLVHTWEGDARCSPSLLAQIGKEYPNVPILLGHSGGKGSAQAPIDAARAAENLYLDITGSLLPRGWLETVVAAVGAERVLFGTDIPFVDARPQIGCVAFARLSDDQKRAILGLNAARLFGL